MAMEIFEKEKLFECFNQYLITDIQKLVDNANTREEKIFYTRILNLKMAFEQEKVVGKELL